MHIIGMFKLSSTFLKLLSSSKLLYTSLIKCENDIIKG